MLTDETIRKIFEEEKNSAGLTKLPDDFFVQVRDYIEKKTRMSRMETDQWALDSIKRRLRTIFEARERKILNSTHGFLSSEVMLDNLTPEEQKFFEKVAECLKGFHGEREGSFEENEQVNLSLVTILEDTPRFVGINMRNYGPFRKGDITTVPEPNAKLLIEKKLAEMTEIKQ